MSVGELKALGVNEKTARSFANSSTIEIAKKLDTEHHELFLKTCKENGMSGAPWLDTYGLVCLHLMKHHGFTSQDIAYTGQQSIDVSLDAGSQLDEVIVTA
jgi:hypothetical protein